MTRQIRLFLCLIFCAAWGAAIGQVPPPGQFEAQPFERHVELTWQTASGASGYEIWRSEDGGTTFSLLEKITGGSQKFRLDWTGDEGVPVSRTYKIRSLAPNGQAGDFSAPVAATTFPMTDDELMEMVQRATFRYFWEGAHPVSGMARERNTSGNTVTTGGTGFGLMAIVVAAERGWVSRTDAVNRLLQIVSFLQIADRFHGVFPHWMNGVDGNVVAFSQFDDGADLVETAFLMQGLLTVRAYFSGNNPTEAALRDVITGLWEDVEWDWFRRNGSNVLYWHWSPNYGWQMNFALRGFNETMICYLLAAASPTHPVPASLYQTGWAGGGYTNPSVHFGYPIYCGPFGGGPMFFAHYSFMGFDPRGRKDQFCNYFTRNRNHALIQNAYSKANPEQHVGYSADCWGLTASDNPWGYLAHDMYPTNDNGTIAPTAALASMPYTPAESMAALRHFYRVLGDRLWGPQGFYDAFNLDANWFASSYLAIDQGPIVGMIENHRTGLLWQKFMSNPEIQPALDAIGFVPDVSDAPEVLPENLTEIAVFPNPARVGEPLQIDAPFSQATLVDGRGATVRELFFDEKNAGQGGEAVPTAGLPSGVYVLKIRLENGRVLARKVVLW
ncbi:MAG: glucoamylase family protein [Saprospiraceae bacterium]